MTFSHSSLCYPILNSLTPIPFPKGQKYLSKNNFFISSFISVNSSTRIPLKMTSSSLLLMYFIGWFSISHKLSLKVAYNFCAWSAMISMAELMTALFLHLQYLPMSGIFCTILNNCLSILIEQNSIWNGSSLLKDRFLLQLQASLELQHLIRKRKQGYRNLVLSQSSFERRCLRCSSTNSYQHLLQMITRWTTDIALMILNGLVVETYINFINFFPSFSFSSRISLSGANLQSMQQSTSAYLSSSPQNSFINAFISINLRYYYR